MQPLSRSGNFSTLEVSESVPQAEGERYLHAGILREDVPVRVVVDLHADVEIPVPAGEPSDAHKVLEREVVAGVRFVEHGPRNVGGPGERIREIHVSEARAQEYESKQRVERQSVEAIIVLPRFIEARARSEVQGEYPARMKNIVLVVRCNAEVHVRMAAPENRD